MGTPPRLDTARLRLREWRRQDLDALVAIKMDPGNWRFIEVGRPRTSEEAESALGEFQDEWHRQGIGRWAVEERANGELIGDCGIVLTNRGPQLAYMIKRSKWGLGFAAEAARAVLEHVWRMSDWPTVYASTHPENVVSQRVLTKLGMRLRQTIDTSAGSECWYGLERGAHLDRSN